MFGKAEDVFILLLLCVPLLAIVGGVVAGIVKTVTQQRQIELVQRERIAAIERGLDPSKLPPLGPLAPSEDVLSSLLLSPTERARRQSQMLMIAGVITFSVGAGVMTLFAITEDQGDAWAIGIVPIAVALGLLVSAWLVRPRGNGSGGAGTPSSAG